MKIGILSCIYGRPQLTDCFAQQLVRLKKFNVIPLVVGSEGEKSKSIARKHSLVYVEAPNQPLGKKFNSGMKIMKAWEPDYVMVLGSDDFITDAYMKRWIEYMKQGWDMIGSLDLYFYNLDTKVLGYWRGYDKTTRRQNEPIGMGRTLSKRLLEYFDWSPWVDYKDQGLDGTSYAKMKKFKSKIKTTYIKDENLFAVDIKSKGNITAFGCFEKNLKMLDIKALKQIPEYDAIRNINVLL